MRSLATWNADRFRSACRQRGWTMTQLSVHSGIPYSQIRSYASGSGTPTPARLVRLAGELQVATTELAPLREHPTLHELRWHSGMTVVELAAAAGYSVSHTSSVLIGAVPIAEPARWAAALNTTQSSVAAAWEAARAEQAQP